MSHYKPYPAYKDSGVEWIGKVPEGWEVRPVYSLATVRNGYPFASELFKHEGVESDRLIRIRDIAGDDEPIFTEETCPASAVISNGDVLIGMDGDFNVHRWMRGPAKLNQRMCAVSGRTEEITQFLSRCLPIPLRIINELAHATTVKHLSSYEVLHTRIAVPSTHELAHIHTVLDRETARIDALIAKKTEFIELLAKKRQALITHAVTKGLDPNVKMKDSGVEWIGDVPEHWERRKLSHAFARIGSGTTPPSDQPEWYSNDGIPWVTTGELRESEITKTTKCITQRALDQFSTLRVYPKGSLVIAMYGATIGRLGILGVSATTNQACCVLSGAKSMTVRFAYYWLLVCKLPIIEIFAAGGGQPNVNQEIISSLRVPSPSIDEQDKIVEYLDREVARLDLLTEKTQLSIDLLKKRRSALITAAVTGQIDLRESA
jgi:type I restriction enzyme S subunit